MNGLSALEIMVVIVDKIVCQFDSIASLRFLHTNSEPFSAINESIVLKCVKFK